MKPKSVQVCRERFFRTSGPIRLPAAPWMKPSRPERSAVWQRTSARPPAEPEKSAAAVATNATRPLSPYFYIGLYCRECTGRLAQLGERLPYKQEVGGSIPSPTIA